MRLSSMFLALGVLTAAAPPSPQQAAARRDWSRSVAPTPQGGMLIGNPAARVKLVEYASYTCPHCAEFAAESKAALTSRLRAGSTSVEYRHLIRDSFDLAAVVVARCGGPSRFARVSDAIFAGQPTWLQRGTEFAKTNAATLSKAQPLALLRALADGSGLSAIGRAQGVTDVELGRCFGNRAALDRIVAAARTVPPEVTGTPAFFVNGRYADAHGWTQLQPLLDAR